MTKDVLSVAEVADELGIAPGSVRTTMIRAGAREVRGYRRRDVERIKAERKRRTDTESEEAQ